MPNPAASPKPKRAPAAKPAKPAAANEKHQRAAEMLRELRRSAESLSANADRLLSRVAR